MRRLFIVRKDLHMSPGKLMAQIAHCTEAYYTNLLREHMNGNNVVEIPQDIVDEYINGRFVKTVCGARNKKQLLNARNLAEQLNLIEGKDFGFIYDACFTELEPEEENGTCLTCFWTAPLSDDTAHAISRRYQLY